MSVREGRDRREVNNSTKHREGFCICSNCHYVRVRDQERMMERRRIRRLIAPALRVLLDVTAACKRIVPSDCEPCNAIRAIDAATLPDKTKRKTKAKRC